MGKLCLLLLNRTDTYVATEKTEASSASQRRIKEGADWATARGLGA